MLAGLGVVASYLFALHDLDFSVAQARTIATSVLVVVGLYLVLVLRRAVSRTARSLQQREQILDPVVGRQRAGHHTAIRSATTW